MTKILIIFLLISTGQIISQNVDSVKFSRIFGCSCCADTLRNPKEKHWKYILTDDKTYMTAYKFGKTKWTIATHHIWGDNDVTIDCVEFYEINNKIILRLYSDRAKSYGEIDPKTGKYLGRHTTKN